MTEGWSCEVLSSVRVSARSSGLVILLATPFGVWASGNAPGKTPSGRPRFTPRKKPCFSVDEVHGFFAGG